MSKLSISQQNNDTIALSGELNRHSVPSISLPQLGNEKQMTIDLKAVTQVDTAGLAWLINLLAQLQRNHITLKLVHLPEQLKKLMQLGHVENLFE